MIGKGRLWAGRILFWFIGFFMAMDTVMHIVRPPFVIASSKKVGIDPNTILIIGILEAVFLALLCVPRFRGLGALGFTAFFGGAVASHVINGGAWIVAVITASLLWLAVCLLDPKWFAAFGLTESPEPALRSK